MRLENNLKIKEAENTAKKFLIKLCKIKGWKYHNNIETEKFAEIIQFLENYVFDVFYVDEKLYGSIKFKKLTFLVKHPSYNFKIKAVLSLMENCPNEKEFDCLFKKANPFE